MTRTCVLAAVTIVACAALTPFAVAAGGGNKSGDAIWIISPAAVATSSPTLVYGQSFSAGFVSKTSYPWAHAQCFDSAGTAFWGEWRALQADGTIGVFELTTANSGVAWPSGSTRCTLELVSTQPKVSMLAATTFTVVAA